MKKVIVGLFALMFLVSFASMQVKAESGSSNEDSADDSVDESMDDLEDSVDSDRPKPTLYAVRNETLRERLENKEEYRNELRSGKDALRNETREKVEELKRETRERFEGLRNETIEKIAMYGGFENLTEEQREELLEESKELFEKIREEQKDKFEDLREEQKMEVEEFKMKMKDGRIEMKIENKQMIVNSLSAEQKELIVGKINARTGLNLSSDDFGNGSLGQQLRAWLSNGNYANVKVMPDQASEFALKRLKAKCDEKGCEVELKEVGRGNNTRAAYEIKTEKKAKFLFFFERKMQVKAEVDAETGEVLSTNKPWWSFLAREEDSTEEEIEDSVSDDVEEEIEVENNITSTVEAGTNQTIANESFS